MSAKKEKKVKAPEAKLTPAESYRAAIKNRIIIGQRSAQYKNELNKLHEQNLVIEGTLRSYENEYGFVRETVGNEVLEEFKKAVPAEKPAK